MTTDFAVTLTAGGVTDAAMDGLADCLRDRGRVTGIAYTVSGDRAELTGTVEADDRQAAVAAMASAWRDCGGAEPSGLVAETYDELEASLSEG